MCKNQNSSVEGWAKMIAVSRLESTRNVTRAATAEELDVQNQKECHKAIGDFLDKLFGNGE